MNRLLAIKGALDISDEAWDGPPSDGEVFSEEEVRDFAKNRPAATPRKFADPAAMFPGGTKQSSQA